MILCNVYKANQKAKLRKFKKEIRDELDFIQIQTDFFKRKIWKSQRNE